MISTNSGLSTDCIDARAILIIMSFTLFFFFASFVVDNVVKKDKNEPLCTPTMNKHGDSCTLSHQLSLCSIEKDNPKTQFSSHSRSFHEGALVSLFIASHNSSIPLRYPQGGKRRRNISNFENCNSAKTNHGNKRAILPTRRQHKLSHTVSPARLGRVTSSEVSTRNGV